MIVRSHTQQRAEQSELQFKPIKMKEVTQLSILCFIIRLSEGKFEIETLGNIDLYIGEKLQLDLFCSTGNKLDKICIV